MTNPNARPSLSSPADTTALREVGLVASLRRCQLFADLAEPALLEIAAFVRTKNVPKNTYLFREGDPAQHFFIVKSGAINVHRVNAAGKEQVLEIFHDGDSFAEAALSSPSGYPANARAIESTSLICIPKNEFLHLLSQNPELTLRMIGAMSRHLHLLVGRLDDLTLKDVETRLANWLVRRCPDIDSAEPTQIILGRTKRVLATELNTTAETLSRTLARFRELGIADAVGNTVHIPAQSKLHKFLQEHLGEK